MNKLARIFLFLTAALFLLSSCNDGKSYADLLKEEDRAVKAFLANKIVINEIPADSVFITLQDVPDNDTLAVPYYKLDNDGNVYMQVLEAGDLDDRFEKGDDVNLRFLRYDLKALVNGENPTPMGMPTALLIMLRFVLVRLLCRRPPSTVREYSIPCISWATSVM